MRSNKKIFIEINDHIKQLVLISEGLILAHKNSKNFNISENLRKEQLEDLQKFLLILTKKIIDLNRLLVCLSDEEGDFYVEN